MEKQSNWYIVIKNGQTIYSGPEEKTAYGLIPRWHMDHGTDTYDMHKLCQYEFEEGIVSIASGKGVYRRCIDSGTLEGKWSGVSIPLEFLKILIGNSKILESKLEKVVQSSKE